MDELAEFVDLSQGGLYYYIKGKKALLFAIMSHALDRLEAEVLSDARRLEDPAESLAFLLRGYLGLVQEEPSVMFLLHGEEASLENGHRTRIKSRKGLFVGFLTDVIASLLYGLDRTEVDPAAAALTALDRLHVSAQEEGGVDDVETAVSALVRRVLDGSSDETEAMAC